MYGFIVDNAVLDDITAVQQHLLILYLNSVKCVFEPILFHVCAVRRAPNTRVRFLYWIRVQVNNSALVLLGKTVVCWYKWNMCEDSVSNIPVFVLLDYHN